MKCLAHTEAVIDFGDDDREGDINDSAMNPLIPIILNLRNELERHLHDGKKGEIIREGVQIALVGQPNSGIAILRPISLSLVSHSFHNRKIFTHKRPCTKTCSYSFPHCWYY